MQIKGRAQEGGRHLAGHQRLGLGWVRVAGAFLGLGAGNQRPRQEWAARPLLAGYSGPSGSHSGILQTSYCSPPPSPPVQRAPLSVRKGFPLASSGPPSTLSLWHSPQGYHCHGHISVQMTLPLSDCLSRRQPTSLKRTFGLLLALVGLPW